MCVAFHSLLLDILASGRRIACSPSWCCSLCPPSIASPVQQPFRVGSNWTYAVGLSSVRHRLEALVLQRVPPGGSTPVLQGASPSGPTLVFQRVLWFGLAVVLQRAFPSGPGSVSPSLPTLTSSSESCWCVPQVWRALPVVFQTGWGLPPLPLTRRRHSLCA